MTIQTLISKIRTLASGGPHSSRDCADFSAHLAECAECSRLVESQSEIRVTLRELRDTAPVIPESLDNKVLSSYRRRIPQRVATHNFASKPQSSIRVVIFGIAAIAATIVVAVVFLVTREQPKAQVITSRNPAAVPAPVIMPVQPRLYSATRSTAGRRPVRRRPTTSMVATAPPQQKTPATSPSMSVPTTFSSLMYCDELSCNGAMDMIRVRLPAQPRMLLPANSYGTGPVYADVLVGPDGIARGIRVVH
jgi:hypothetical protein